MVSDRQIELFVSIIDRSPEPCELTGMAGLLAFLNIADRPEFRVVLKPLMKLPARWYLPQPPDYQRLEDAYGVS